MPRERMRDLELPAYMRALVEAREKWMEESSGRLDEHIEHLEWIDTLATALGISVDAEDWWDSTIPAKRTKIMGRISVLRGLRPAPETGPRLVPLAESRDTECPNTHAGKHIPGESYKVCWYCQL